MKHCRKSPEPAALTHYRTVQPDSALEQMKGDALHGGQQAYADVKSALVCEQRGLCVYCEIYLAQGLGDSELNQGRPLQRVEHFHPKNDTGGPVNHALDWPNVWAVCLGGSLKPPEGEPLDPAHYLPPLPENLSCDAFKDHQIQKGQLKPNPEGWILAPHEVPAFPRLFRYAPDGTPEPDAGAGGGYAAPDNRHPDTVTLVAETITHLNLGCARLNRVRRIAKAQLDKLIKKRRDKAPGAPPETVLQPMLRHLFSTDVSRPWCEFFTLIRWRLGEMAESHLRSIEFDG